MVESLRFMSRCRMWVRGVGHFGGQLDINCHVQEKLRWNWKLGTKAGVLSWDGFPGRGSWQTAGWLLSEGSICTTGKSRVWRFWNSMFTGIGIY